MTFPTEYDMTSVISSITDFLSNPIVVGAVMLLFGFVIAPRAVAALRAAVDPQERSYRKWLDDNGITGVSRRWRD
jgi:hypothetical protein